MTINDIKFTWEVNQIHVAPSSNGLSNLVTKIAYTLWGEYTDENGNTFKDWWSAATVIELDPNATFIPLNEITQEIAELWIMGSENKKQRDVEWLKNKVRKRLEDRVNPPIVVIDSPFVKK